MSIFLRKKGSLYAILKNENSFRRDSKPNPRVIRSELSTTELFDLLMTVHKKGISTTHTLFTFQSPVCTCQYMTNCEEFRTNCCVKIAATLILDSIIYRRCLFDRKSDKNVTLEGKPECVLKQHVFPLNEFREFNIFT